jgi:hypothetical protein
VHIRRGDYAYVKEITAIHGICSMDYYFEAMELIKKIFPTASFFIFSDDVDWVKENFQQPNNYIITPNLTSPQEDLRLMSMCTHHIIANSSFSWWAAWLNPLVNKLVVSPREWMKGKFDLPIINKDWISI